MNQEVADLEVRQSLFEKKLGEAELLNPATLEQTPDTDEEVQDELITASEFHCKISLELSNSQIPGTNQQFWSES